MGSLIPLDNIHFIIHQLMASGDAAVTACVTMVGVNLPSIHFLPLIYQIQTQVPVTWDFESNLHLTPVLIAGSIVFLCRNPTLNPGDFFDRSFEEYKNGFANHGIYYLHANFNPIWLFSKMILLQGRGGLVLKSSTK